MLVSLSLLLAGCGGHANVQFSSSGSPSSGVSSGGSVRIQASSSAGALIAIGILAGASYASNRRYEERSIPAPELDPARRVHEQDCTRPIEDWSANLKCK